MSIIRISKKGWSRKKWLMWRKKNGVGASEASGIAGVSVYNTPRTIYEDKISDYIDEDISEPAYWGLVLEDIVAKEFSKRSGLKVRQSNFIYKNTKYPFAYVNVDRMIVGKPWLVECKTANAFFYPKWETDTPGDYIIQTQFQMAVTETERVYVPCLIGGQTFTYEPIERDQEIIDPLMEQVEKFWHENVLKKIPPQWSGMKSEKDVIKRLFPREEKVKEFGKADSAYYHIFEGLLEEKKNKKIIEKKINTFELQIKELIGNQAGIYCDDIKATWGSKFNIKRIGGYGNEQ